jgi:predicted pyridoxine 5'-phosphate oxidase superfamily flavin-nucleotide-binding protein
MPFATRIAPGLISAGNGEGYPVQVGRINPDMRRVVEEQRLCFAATICEDGTANLSPKGTVTVLDDDHLIFVDLASPQTVKNLRANPSIEINVVDPVIRKGFRFKGRGIVIDPGERFDELLERFTSGSRAVRDAKARIRHIVVIEVERALSLVSPAYDDAVTEEDVSARWEVYFLQMWEARRRS